VGFKVNTISAPLWAATEELAFDFLLVELGKKIGPQKLDYSWHKAISDLDCVRSLLRQFIQGLHSKISCSCVSGAFCI
jgi:hypothetical protein